MAAPAPKRPMKILFVCVGNACRSQMAEAFANHAGGGRVMAYSAGSHPLGMIISETYDAMQGKGINLDGQWSKGLRDVPVEQMDVVVGMGCEVECPVPAGFKGQVIEWEIPDPYGRSPEYFRRVRDQIEQQVAALVGELDGERSGGGPGTSDRG